MSERNNKTQQVCTFLKHGHPRLAFGVLLIQCLNTIIALVAIALGLTYPLPLA